MNRAVAIGNINNTEVQLGTIVYLHETVTLTNKLYMLVEHDFGEATLVNLSDGRVWSHEKIKFPRGTTAVSYGAFKDYCYVDFDFVNRVDITKEGS